MREFKWQLVVGDEGKRTKSLMQIRCPMQVDENWSGSVIRMKGCESRTDLLKP
jgi:hypothetical protein